MAKTGPFQAALIHGPPGIGKTTTAKLIAVECGYDPRELNASDTRSTASLKQIVGQLCYVISDDRCLK